MADVQFQKMPTGLAIVPNFGRNNSLFLSVFYKSKFLWFSGVLTKITFGLPFSLKIVIVKKVWDCFDTATF